MFTLFMYYLYWKTLYSTNLTYENNCPQTNIYEFDNTTKCWNQFGHLLIWPNDSWQQNFKLDSNEWWYFMQCLT